MTAAKIPFLDELTRRNRLARDTWAMYAEHRGHVGRLLGEAAANQSHPRRLAALGAGNRNDLDLAALAGDYDELYLVDIDANALADGVARQSANVPPSSKIKTHGRM